jgi:peptidoglycan/LPS O-acetylase OafA/YrhL
MQGGRFLDTRTSILLDLVRGVAAVGVLIGHAGQLGLLGRGWPLDDTFQHSAVVIFFVLSGLMIQQSASREGMTPSDFAKARAARILPVTIFAMAFSTLMLVYLGRFLPMTAISSNHVALTPATIVTPLLFLSERSAGIEPAFNPPFWSLCYEVWFYILFGIWTFMRGWRRAAAITLAAAIADAPVLLLLPVWLLGTLVGSRGAQAEMRRPGVILFLALAGFAIASWTGIQHRSLMLAGEYGLDLTRLRYSSYFITDAVAAACIALAFVAMRAVRGDPGWLKTPARWLAGLSFTLYLTHWPLLVAIFLMLGPQPVLVSAMVAIIAPIGFAAVLAPPLERWMPRALRGFSLRSMRRAGGLGSPSASADAPRFDGTPDAVGSL